MVMLHYSITKEDFINYYTYIRWDEPGKKRKHFFYYLQQLLLNGSVIAILLFTGLFRSRPSFLYVYIGIIVIILLLQFFSGRSKIQKQAERIADDPYNLALFKETALQVSETGIYYKDDTKEARFHWNAFIKKMENDAYYFLFVHQTEALIIPKKSFRSPADKTAFDHLLNTHLSLDAEVAHLL